MCDVGVVADHKPLALKDHNLDFLLDFLMFLSLECFNLFCSFLTDFPSSVGDVLTTKNKIRFRSCHGIDYSRCIQVASVIR